MLTKILFISTGFSLSFDNKATMPITDYSESKLDVLIPAYLAFLEKLRGRKSHTSRAKIAALSMASPALPSIQEVAGQLTTTFEPFSGCLPRKR
ncbi:hypothetical protein [Chryseolinea sp. H1M3-3]|uniref:hypothetical protein n=1 Tax=Chryseolinea sp. H1M3-3 TaxID=3034144 RepID=UPI0023EB5EA0|nr:hypothetical protein [Chryseolinea sp. H1M3-3]